MNNKKPTIWAILAAAAFLFKDNPELLSFLDPALSAKVLGIASIVCAFLSGRYIKYTVPTEPSDVNVEKVEPNKPI